MDIKEPVAMSPFTLNQLWQPVIITSDIMQNQPNPPAVSSLSDDPNYQNQTFARDLSNAMLRNHPNHQLVSLHQLNFGEILFLICFVSR
jgi:hypothetical protein